MRGRHPRTREERRDAEREAAAADEASELLSQTSAVLDRAQRLRSAMVRSSREGLSRTIGHAPPVSPAPPALLSDGHTGDVPRTPTQLVNSSPVPGSARISPSLAVGALSTDECCGEMQLLSELFYEPNVDELPLLEDPPPPRLQDVPPSETPRSPPYGSPSAGPRAMLPAACRSPRGVLPMKMALEIRSARVRGRGGALRPLNAYVVCRLCPLLLGESLGDAQPPLEPREQQQLRTDT